MPLECFFHPRSLALVGATDREGSVGRAVLENLRTFPGRLFAVNAKRGRVLDLPAFASLTVLPQVPELVVIVTPAATVPVLVQEAGKIGVKAVVVISAGFKETGPEGARIEAEALAAARVHGVRLIGPNCLGLMNPHAGLNATFATSMARPGSVAFLSQSGALCTAILDWSHEQNVGFSAFVSTGAMADVGWGDLIRHFGADPHTRSIVMYLESIGGDAAGFLDAAREVAQRKPIVVIKAGRTAEAARAAASHTGAMTGSDDVLDAALRQNGVLRVDTIEELFDMAEVLSKQPLPVGPRLAIVTNAGGPGALATDALVLGGGSLAQLSSGTLMALNDFLPASWSQQNPVDVLGDADAVRYAKALQIVAADENVDGVLAVLTPQAMTHPTEIAREVAILSRNSQKPLLASWMGAQSVREGRAILNAACLPTYDYPDEAARAFVRMHEQRERLDWLRETHAALRAENRHHLRIALPKTSGLLNEAEAKNLLQAAGIPVVSARAALSEDEAVLAADAMGYPAVLKLLSPTITHKSDCGGVQLHLRDAAAVRAAWLAIRRGVTQKHGADAFGGVTVQPMILEKGVEIILGMTRDPQFGPVLLFGAGGTLVEVLLDRCLALPPINEALARRWMRHTKIFRILEGHRGAKAVDLTAVEQAMVCFARLANGSPRLMEIDINPLLATEAGVMALDARIVLS